MEEYQQLLNNISHIIMKYDEMDRINGSKFNIFQVLNIAEDELKHSLFLAELLNPKGRHGQGSLFLKLFVEKVGIDDFDTESSNVETEKYIGKISESESGRIDIFLEDKDRKTIVIENKIYAGDMPQQLIRYYKFSSQYNSKNILYLTLNGGSPSDDSIKSDSLNLIKDENFKVISYQSHIVEWLELCRKESVNFPLLREGLLHYINLIKYLTGQSTNKRMEEEILQLAFQSKENLEMIAVIGNNYGNIKTQFHFRFWETLKEEFKNQGLMIELEHERSINSKANLEKNYGYWIPVKEFNKHIIYYSIFFDDCVYHGFNLEKKGKEKESEEFHKYSDLLQKAQISYERSPYWLGLKKIKPRLDFYNSFNPIENQKIFELIEKDNLQNLVISIAEEALNDIKKFKEILENSK
jgi:hypothetical protein